MYQFGRWEDHKPLEGTDGKIMEKLREINFIKPIGIPGVPHGLYIV